MKQSLLDTSQHPPSPNEVQGMGVLQIRFFIWGGGEINNSNGRWEEKLWLFPSLPRSVIYRWMQLSYSTLKAVVSISAIV